LGAVTEKLARLLKVAATGIFENDRQSGSSGVDSSWLHLDPVYVEAHHLARFLVVTFAIAVATRRTSFFLP
jgi:hypothetical protein